MMTAKTPMTAMRPALLVLGGSLNLNRGLPWSAARSAAAALGWGAREPLPTVAGAGAASATALKHSDEQNVPWEASSRHNAQTALPHRSQLATAGVSEWFWHWAPIERHFVPSATIGIGSSDGGRFTPSDDVEEGEGPSSKMDSIFCAPELATDAGSAAGADSMYLGTSRPSTKAAWHSLEQNVPSFSSTTHMRQIDLSQALHVASAIDSGWLAQLLSIPVP